MSEAPAIKRVPDQKFCHGCGKALHVAARTCPSCGAEQAQVLQQEIPTGTSHQVAQQVNAEGSERRMTEAPVMKRNADQKFCHGCGKALHISARSCPSCGAEQAQVLQHVPIGSPIVQSGGMVGAVGPQKY